MNEVKAGEMIDAILCRLRGRKQMNRLTAALHRHNQTGDPAGHLGDVRADAYGSAIADVLAVAKDAGLDVG